MSNVVVVGLLDPSAGYLMHESCFQNLSVDLWLKYVPGCLGLLVIKGNLSPHSYLKSCNTEYWEKMIKNF